MTLGPAPVDPTFDSLLHDLGSFGLYQIYTIALLCIPASFLNSWTLYDLVFLLYNPEKSCQSWNTNSSFVQDTLGNVTDQCEYEGRQFWNGHSNVQLHCENWTWDQQYFDQTLMTQWGLCQYPVLSKNVISIYTLVGLGGLIIMSLVQDWIGRKWAFIICLTLTLIGNGFSLLAPSFVSWLGIRAIQTTQAPITYSLCFIWAEEFVDPRKRTLVNFIITLFYSTATVSIGLIAWACHNWIKLGIVVVAPFLLLYSYYWLVDESPRWLLSVGRVDEAKRIIKKIAIWNKKEGHLAQIMDHVDLISKSTLDTHTTTFQPLELFRYTNLRWKVLVLTLVWIANILVYNSMAFNAPNLANMFVAFIAQASVEAPACIFNLVLSNRIGRIPPMVVSMFWSAFFCFMCIPAFTQSWDSTYIIIFTALAKFGICISYNILYQAAGELYPTSLRATGIGVNNFVGVMFIGVMPYILGTGETAKWIPMVILGSITFVAAVCCCLLPEPMDQPMPQTAAEAEKVSKVGLSQIKVHVRNLCKCCYK